MYFQDQSCYYEGYKKSITCQCDINLDKSFLLLRLAYNIREIGQEVSAHFFILYRDCDPQCNDDNARFTTVSLKVLSRNNLILMYIVLKSDVFQF